MPEETVTRTPNPLVVSLDLELLALANATRGAEILADYQTRQGFMDDEAEQDAPVAVFSILSLVGGRLDQLRRVIRGEEDPAHIWAPHNAVAFPESLADTEGDIVLFPWSAYGKPMVLARPSMGGPAPEERAREPKGKEPKGRKAPKDPKGKEAAPEAPGIQAGQPEGKEAVPEAPGIPGKGSKGSPPETH
ncbi:hypothetical protein [Melittangium boletus]|uniref:Uncharacterized protein n=1 Tax=Melittangium boletus DSM 14713 TaxID=1294270 RepID=A0A250IN99_9BACT|nr:hypothetical protein [Melittangium boletus]ATB32733.1 hypothetical protein MEBOL_006222 [Melittangium boletus DSM 14713]